MRKLIFILFLLPLFASGQRYVCVYKPPAPFKPTDVDSCILWLDASKGITLNGATVSKWNNQAPTGSTYDVKQGTVVNQPILVSGAFNGKDALRFDGDDFLTLNNGIGGNYYTIFFVGKKTNLNSYLIPLGGYNTYLADNNGTFSVVNESVGWANFSVDTNTNINLYVVSETTVISTAKLWINNSSISQTGLGIANTYFLYSTIGRGWRSSLYTTGDIAEIIIYDNIISEIQRLKVQTYLNTKYSIY